MSPRRMDDPVKQLYEQALEAGRRRDYPQAVRLLQELLVDTDQFPDALLLLGRSYHALGDYARAAQVLQLYLNANPGSAQGYFFAGRSCLALGLPELAARYLKHSVELEPGFAPALGLLALAVLKSGKPALAVGLFEQALTLDPKNPRLSNGYLRTPGSPWPSACTGAAATTRRSRCSPTLETAPRQPGRAPVPGGHLPRTAGDLDALPAALDRGGAPGARGPGVAPAEGRGPPAARRDPRRPARAGRGFPPPGGQRPGGERPAGAGPPGHDGPVPQPAATARPWSTPARCCAPPTATYRRTPSWPSAS